MAKKKITIESIIVKAIKDKNFYKELKKNPKKVLEKLTGKKLSAELRIKVIDQKENELYLVIPKLYKKEKLTEKELKKVAGGGEKYYDCVGRNSKDLNPKYTEEEFFEMNPDLRGRVKPPIKPIHF